MTSAPGLAYLPNLEQQMFAREFEKEMEFFELLILMLSKSLPTGSVDITWMEGPGGSRQVLGTTQAMEAACSRSLFWDRVIPSQDFCNIVNQNGRRAAESCGRCENAAEQRACASGRAEIYRCHAGLTDIAVPVLVDGRHIATLYSGQVLSAPPSKAGFEQVVQNVKKLSYIDIQQLEEAYWRVPVVSEEDLKAVVRTLEVFADYLSRLWKRLGDTVRIERQKLRANQLAAKELAYLLLRPEIEDRSRLTQLMKQLRFVQPPNRVMVIRLGGGHDADDLTDVFDVAFTRALQKIEQIAENTPNVAVAYLRARGVCVLFRELTEGSSAGLRARTLAQRVISAVADSSAISVRVGIGGVRSAWQGMSESYHEACLALAGSAEAIVTVEGARQNNSGLTVQTEILGQHLLNGRIEEALVALRSLPLLANRAFGLSSVGDQREALSSALEILCAAALKVGCEADALIRIRSEGLGSLASGITIFDVQSAFLKAGEEIAGEVSASSAGKHEKVVSRVKQMLERRLKQGQPVDSLSLSEAARLLGVSTGHLSRTFKRVTGRTFRDYTLSYRIDYARRLLLDPLNNVSCVSDRCGFSSPAYFARVFRKFSGITPTEYAEDPRRHLGQGTSLTGLDAMSN